MVDFNFVFNKILYIIYSISTLSIAIYSLILRMNKSTWKDFNPNWEKNPYVYACWVHFPTGKYAQYNF